MKILALTAHPDDIEFMCAGTLLHLKDRGHEITMALINSGSCGSATLGPREIETIRGKEARAAADLLGATFVSAGIPDLESTFDNPTRRLITEIVRRAQPDIVLTHMPGDYMMDHEMASLLARDATFTATLNNYSTDNPNPAPILPKLPYLYYFAPMEGIDHFGQKVPLGLVVDVTDVMERKEAMLACHASQREWLRHEHGIDEYIEFLRRLSKSFGALRGLQYGEAFRQHRGHAYPHDDKLCELLKPLAAPPD